MKNYCVHIYERANEYENVLAASPAEAEQKVVNREYAGSYDDIANIEVMVQCPNCGYDNEPNAEKCDDCHEEITEVENEPQPTNP